MAKQGRKRYLRQVRKWLPFGGKMKREMMAQIAGCVDDFLEEAPEASFERLCERFGSPQTIAAAYIDSAETTEILRRLRIRRKIVLAVVAAALAMVAIYASVVAYFVWDTMYGYGEEGPIVIIEDITYAED